MIAILEDDRSIRELTLYTLKNSQFDAIGFSNGIDFFDSLSDAIPDLLLLDIMLPGEDGLEILSKLRKREDTKKLPIIMLTAKDTEFDKIIGLDNGADDYVTKPFSMLELISRIKALLRRTEKVKSENKFSFKSLFMDDESHKVYILNKPVEMTLKEYNTLKLLLENQGKVITRDFLLNSVWGYDFDGETRTVDVHIRTIRSKLDKYGDYIETVRGVGYRIGEKND